MYLRGENPTFAPDTIGTLVSDLKIEREDNQLTE